MSATQRLLYHTLSGGSSPSSSLRPRSFIAFFRLRPSCAVRNCHFFASPSLRTSLSAPDSTMPRYNRKGGSRDQWKEKLKSEQQPSSMETAAAAATDPATFTSRYGAMSAAVNSRQAQAHRVWKAKPYGTAASSAAPTENQSTDQLVAGMKGIELETSAPAKIGSGLSKLFKAPPVEKFTVDNSTYLVSQIRATFYPKFENEKSDQEIRLRMIEIVSKGLATLEVSLKHSGSLFMYSGHEGGAYAKNSYGNIYTAVGVFVLGRTFHEAWGTEAAKKQAEFNSFLEKNRMCISMELVTAVLGDHGQRPKEDYVVVTAVTELGNGKPKFFSTPEIIVFCRKWRLPTNHTWLFSTRKSATAFFAAYDALCEEGIASSVCKALDEIADISVPGSKDHVKVQGEILEGLVARIVTSESSTHMEKVMGDFLPPPSVGVDLDLGSSLREICAAHRSDEKQQIKALLQSVGTSFCPNYLDWFGTDGCDSHSRNVDRSVLSKFLQAHPADFSTAKLQEMIRLMREKRFPAAFKCYHNFHKIDSTSNDDLYFKMAIHVHSDSAFRRYQREMRLNPGLWPLYRGFFVDLNLFRANKERASKIVKNLNSVNTVNGSSSISRKDSLDDEDANLMVKLKFLTYKLRTFLIRNGLTILLKDGPAAYKAYYLRQMKIWGTSEGKQRELSQMLDEWAVYIRRKYGHKNLSSSVYLSEAEPFLEQYAKRSPRNQVLIGSAGNFVRAEDFLAIIEGGRDEEGDLEKEREVAPSTPIGLVKDIVPKVEGMIVFFPGIPGCAKSALCKELMSTSGDFGDDRPVRSLMGDLIKGRYWQRVADEHRKKPNSVMLADKNAPNEEVWMQIEEMCRRTRSSAVPVVPDSEGTDSNPFSLDALAVFLFRVLQRVNHPGNLDKESPNVGYVLLMFYHLYEGKNRKEFEGSLIERFGSLIKMPLLKPDRSPLPDPLKSTLEEGINLYHLHKCRHGRLDSTKGSYAAEWVKWEKKLRETLLSYAGHLNSIQVPYADVVDQTRKQLTIILKGDYKIPSTEKRKVGTVVFAAVSLPVTEIQSGLLNLSATNPKVEAFLKDKNIERNLTKAHVTLAHKRSHGVTAVANYGVYLHRQVPVHLNALFFSEKMAAFETSLGSVDGEKINSKNQWPHVTLWTGAGVAAKDANILPQLHSEGKATRVDVNPPISLSGTLEFF